MIDNKDELIIPKELFEELHYAKKHLSQSEIDKVVEKILKSHMFQMLNDYPIPHEYCLHLRQMVYPDKNKTNVDGTMYKSYQCINCKKYL